MFKPVEQPSAVPLLQRPSESELIHPERPSHGGFVFESDQQMEANRHGNEEQIDTGDVWVRSRSKVFGQNGYNWNQEVEGLLDEEEEELEPAPSQTPSKRQSRQVAPANVSIRRHRKKSKKQLEVLESHFELDREWSLDLVEKLATDLCLEKDQVYKWNWDKRKRLRKKAEREGKAVPSNKKRNKRQRTN